MSVDKLVTDSAVLGLTD